MPHLGEEEVKKVDDVDIVVNRQLDHYGHVQFSKDGRPRTMRINPGAGDLVNTLLHEKLHVDHPDMDHDEVYARASKMERTMSFREISNLVGYFADRVERTAPGPKFKVTRTNTVVSKVVKPN